MSVALCGLRAFSVPAFGDKFVLFFAMGDAENGICCLALLGFVSLKPITGYKSIQNIRAGYVAHHKAMES